MKILNFSVYLGNISSIKNIDNAISIFSGEGLKFHLFFIIFLKLNEFSQSIDSRLLSSYSVNIFQVRN